jgi:hypothetical protein
LQAPERLICTPRDVGSLPASSVYTITRTLRAAYISAVIRLANRVALQKLVAYVTCLATLVRTHYSQSVSLVESTRGKDLGICGSFARRTARVGKDVIAILSTPCSFVQSEPGSSIVQHRDCDGNLCLDSRCLLRLSEGSPAALQPCETTLPSSGDVSMFHGSKGATQRCGV